jgi:hypothetical protein
VVAGAPVALRRSLGRVPLALIVALAFLALLVFGLHSRSKSGPTATGASSTPSTAAGNASATTAAPATTVPPSPTASLANDLRAAAGRLSPADGARAGDLATALRQVADQVQAGTGGPSATGAIVSAGAWRLTGQLSEAAASSAIALLSRVPGVTVVTLPSTPVVPVPGVPTPAPTNGNGKGKDKKD